MPSRFAPFAAPPNHDPQGQAPALHQTGRPMLPLQGVSLLLVEDSRLASDAWRLICIRSGARLRRAATLAAAARHLATQRPDLVIVDLGLPDGRGEDLIAPCAARGLPVLAISGDPDGEGSALAAGACGFLVKPVTGIARIQRIVLHALGADPTRAADDDRPLPPGDPLALRDDLEQAAQLLERPGQADHARRFLLGVARIARDGALADAAHNPLGMPDLAGLIRQRLDRTPPLT